MSTLATATRGCLLGIGSVRWMDKLGLSGLYPDARGGGFAGWLCLGLLGVALQWLSLGTWPGGDTTFVPWSGIAVAALGDLDWQGCHICVTLFLLEVPQPVSLMRVGHEQAALLAQKVDMSRREGSEWTLQGKQLTASCVSQIWFSSDRDNHLEPAC